VDFNPTRVRLKRCRVFGRSRSPSLQPHKGASETAQSRAARQAAFHFNPTRVRLKPRSPRRHRRRRRDFNPTRVRLKLGSCTPRSDERTDFNPTRVRLKPGDKAAPCPESRGLQPHKGASETTAIIEHAYDDPHFNPTRVRLKRAKQRYHGRDANHFNPTRERLKLGLLKRLLVAALTSTPQGCV